MAALVGSRVDGGVVRRIGLSDGGGKGNVVSLSVGGGDGGGVGRSVGGGDGGGVGRSVGGGDGGGDGGGVLSGQSPHDRGHALYIFSEYFVQKIPAGQHCTGVILVWGPIATKNLASVVSIVASVAGSIDR